MNDIWKAHSVDFDNMCDDEIARYSREMQRNLDEAEEWLEAVAAWEKAGKPRSVGMEG